jgi:APA family basic amino acid/polyamine antiporter
MFSATMVVAGGVIGSGIFRKPGTMAAQLGSPFWLLGVWLLAGVVSIFGALTNAELASMMPQTGGQYVFLRRAHGPFLAFLYGWSLFIVIQSGSIAALAYVFAEYSSRIFTFPASSPDLARILLHVPLIGDVAPFQELSIKIVASGVILILTVVNYLGVRLGAVVQNVFSLSKMAAMAGLALAVALIPGVGQVSNLTTASGLHHPAELAWLTAIAGALQGAFWAYDGWHKITYIGGELKSPQRDLPRSLILGILIVTGLYLLMSLVYSYSLPIDEMARSKLVAADVAERCLSGGGRWIALAVMLSTFGAANAVILTSARVYYSMAQDQLAPQLLRRAHPRFHTPSPALVLQGFWSIALLYSGTFDMLTDTLIFVSWFFYIANAGALIVLRQRDPTAPRPFKVPLYPWVPLVFMAFGLIYLVLTVTNDYAGFQSARAAGQPALLKCGFGLGLVLSGTPLYWFYRYGRVVSPTTQEISGPST